VDGEGHSQEVAQIRSGDFFGELSMLRNSKHTKSAHAIEDSEIMVLPKRSFEALLQGDPDLAEQVRRKRAELGEDTQRS
jgi:CRP-like cAMP-binding protein